MKQKFLLLISFFMLVLFITACETEDPTVDQSPVISGAVDKTIERGSVFVPLQGVSALDDEDGDLTDDITYSGNVNPNVAGVYTATYTVTDSFGNVETVSVTITVVIVDTEAPLISGAGDLTISVGEPGFNVLTGVTANDTIDGDLTSDITYTGSVNTWLPGTYQVSYAVEDEAGNEAVRERNVTVSLGYFVFGTENALLNGSFDTDSENWTVTNGTSTVSEGTVSINVTGDATFAQTGVSGGVMNTSVADYTLAKLVIRAKASAARAITASINQAETTTSPIELTTTMAEYTQYFRMSDVLNNATLTFNLGSGTGTVDFESVSMLFGVSADKEAPILTVPSTDVVAPVSNLEALTSLVLRGVRAMDNIDGNITSMIELDLDGIDISVAGSYQIPITVSDNAGNETITNRLVYLYYSYEEDVILDQEFNEALNTDQWALSGGGEQVTLYTENGNLIVDIVSPGGWDSATSPFLKNITTDQLLPGNWYMFQYDVKAEKDRYMTIRAGLELYGEPWIEDFQNGAVKNLQYQVTTEWQTHYYVFYVEKATSEVGSNVVKFEIKLGTITGGQEEFDNKVYIDNAQFHLLTQEWIGYGMTVEQTETNVAITYPANTWEWWNNNARLAVLDFDGTKTSMLFTFTGVAGHEYLFKIEGGGSFVESAIVGDGTEQEVLVSLAGLTEVQRNGLNLIVVFVKTEGVVGTIVVNNWIYGPEVEPEDPEWMGFGMTVEQIDTSVSITYPASTWEWWNNSARLAVLDFDGTKTSIMFTFTGVVGHEYVFKIEGGGVSAEAAIVADGTEQELEVSLEGLTEAQRDGLNLILVFVKTEGVVGTVVVNGWEYPTA
jgi:hypothetical protein